MTKVVMTLLVRDEPDIVAANMAFHLAMGVDHIIVTNNKSEDETKDIIIEYVRQGVATLIDEFGDDYDQSAWVTRMARIAACDLAADWVINSDADEFWWPLEGNFKSVFSGLSSSYGTLLAPRLNFLPMRALSRVFWREMVWRYVTSRNGLGGPLPGKAAHRGVADVIVAPGNHTVASPSLAPAEHRSPIVIFHFPYRSYAQYSDKIMKGGQAVENNRKIDEGIFHVWRRHHALQREGRLERWYRQLPHGDDPILQDMLLKGEVVKDERLKMFMGCIGK